MSHRDSTIKTNKELSKPMDLFNVGFVGNVGGGEIEVVVTEDGNWSQTPTDLGLCIDGNLSTSNVVGYMDHTNGSQNQEIRVDYGESITNAMSVKIGTRINGAGSDNIVAYLESSTDGSNWTARSSFANAIDDVETQTTLTTSSITFRYLRIRLTRNNTFRVGSLWVYEFYVT